VEQIIVNDPWRDDQVRIDKRWGDSATVVEKVNYYSGHVTEAKHAMEVRPPTRCLKTAAVTGKHLLFVGTESLEGELNLLAQYMQDTSMAFLTGLPPTAPSNFKCL